MPYEGEPLAPQGDDIMDEISEETTKEADLDGMTPAILEARYDRKNKVDWAIPIIFGTPPVEEPWNFQGRVCINLGISRGGGVY